MTDAPADEIEILGRADATVLRTLGLAAELGARRRESIPITFTDLLAACLFLAPRVRRTIERQGLSIAFPEIVKAAGTDEKALAEVAAQLAPTTAPPTLGQLTQSARQVIGTADGLRHGSGPLRLPHLLATYLHDAPSDHSSQLANWGFGQPTAAVLAAAFPDLADPKVWATSPLYDMPGEPGFDPQASAILHYGRLLARHRSSRADPPYTASTLMAAMADNPFGFALPEFAALLDTLRVADPNSDYARYRRESYQTPTDPVAETHRELSDTSPPAESPGLRSIREEAVAIAALTIGPDAPAAPRHLAAAQILTRGGEINEQSDWLISRRGLSSEAWREGLLAVVIAHYPFDDPAAWQRILSGPRVVARVQADTIPGDPRNADVLGLRRYSDAIAALIASRALVPPLSIAVFGAWGSGKSFFMRMIRRAVEETVAETGRQGDVPLFLTGGIVHIEFNAWHYAEENLWASLVQAILVGVDARLSPKPPPPVFQQVLDNLVEREKAESEAQQRLVAAGENLTQCRAALADAEADAAKARAAQANLVAEDVLVPMREMAVAALLGPEIGDPNRWLKHVSDSLTEVAAAVGRPELAAGITALQTAGAAATVQVGELQDVLDRVHANERHGRALLAWLLRQRMPSEERRLLVSRAAAAFAGLAALALCAWSYGQALAGFMSAIASLLLPLMLATKPVIAWLRRRLGEVDGALGILEDLRRRIEKKQAARLSEYTVELKSAHNQVAAAEAEVARGRIEVEAAGQAVTAAREEVREASAAQQMKRFVGQRLEDGDYLRRLGLIHTISLDLARLEELVRQIQLDPDTAGAGAERVRRVVLYIDDLDRCPPKRVVEVLEAVHLLLAFELFIVVVGVDIRWVEQALRERYPQQLRGDGGIASPMDYLEKVFQIPFWLPPMDPTGTQALLRASIGPIAVAPTPPGASGAAPAVPGANGGVPGSPTPVPGAGAGARGSDSGETPAGPAVAPENLLITRAELDQIVLLAEAVGISPRRAKRFANLYRLLKASLSVEERSAFVIQDGAGNYRAAMTLLALTTGAPRSAAAFLQKVETVEPTEIGELELLLHEITPPEAEKIAFNVAGDAIKQEWQRASDKAEMLRRYQFWAPRARRFAFAPEALAPAPVAPGPNP